MFHVVGVHACLTGVEEIEQRPEVDGLDVGEVHGGNNVDNRDFLEQVAVCVVCVCVYATRTSEIY